jgi:hypothetical protein
VLGLPCMSLVPAGRASFAPVGWLTSFNKNTREGGPFWFPQGVIFRFPFTAGLPGGREMGWEVVEGVVALRSRVKGQEADKRGGERVGI